MNAPRVVLDTNTLVSTLVFRRGRLACLRIGWQAGRFVPVVCRETVEELLRVLAYPKFKLEAAEIDALLADLLPWVETCPVRSPNRPVSGLTDEADRVFVHLARQSRVGLLISGDAHVLAIRETISRIEILSPAEFIVRLGLEQ